MALDGVRAQANELHISLRKLWLELGECTKLGCAYLYRLVILSCSPNMFAGSAHWSVVLGMAEENTPTVANELVEVDWAISCVCVKIWSRVSQAEGACALFTHFASSDGIQ